MRVRLQSVLEEVSLGCWYEIPATSRNAYIEDLIRQLHSDLNLSLPSSALGLEMESFDLPRRSRIEGVLRDGDILTLKRVDRLEYRSQGLPRQLSHHLDQNQLRHNREIAHADEENEVRTGSLDGRIEAGIETPETETDRHDNISAQVRYLIQQLEEMRDTIEVHENTISSLQHAQTDKLLALSNVPHTDSVHSLPVDVRARDLSQQTPCSLKTAPRATPSIPISSSTSAQPSTVKPAKLSSTSNDSNSSSSLSNSSIGSSTSTYSSSSSSSASSSTSSSDSESAVEVLSSKIQGDYKSDNKAEAVSNGLPFQGNRNTATRNDRKKRQTMLQRLVNAGKLPRGSNFKTLERYQEAYANGDEAALESLRAGAKEFDQKETALGWNYPDQPEDGWEKRLVVKEIECESHMSEQRLEVQQFHEEEERGRKRKRMEHNGSAKRWQIMEDEVDVVVDADMYGDAIAIVTNEVAPMTQPNMTTSDAKNNEADDVEDGEVPVGRDSTSQENKETSSSAPEKLTDFPPFPTDYKSLPKLDHSSPLLSQPGGVLAFKHMEMQNFRPVFSRYKTARILECDGDELILQLADRDVEAPMYDYEGERVPGPFAMVDENGDIIEGRIAVNRVDLIDPIMLVGRAS